MTIRISFLLYFLISSSSLLFASVATVYPFPQGLEPAKDFSVSVNNQPAFVYDSPVGALAHFESTETVTVIITVTELDVKRVDIRPLKYNIQYTLQGRKIILQVPPGVNLSVELNGNLKRPIFLVSNLPDKAIPNRNASNVRYFQAGRIYEVGPVLLKDNEQVYIEGGAIVKGSFKADHARNVSIRGYGIIDGTNVRGEEEYREAVKNYRSWRKLIHFLNCENVTLENVILLNSNTWNVVPDNSHGVLINNIKILCGNPSDDGIDILQSSNVTIKNSFIRSKDDCIAFKSLLETRPDRGIRDVTVENCTLWSAEWGNALEIGFETLTASIENVTFKDCTVIHEEGGAVFSMHNADYAVIRKISYENIVVEDASDKLFDLAIFVSLFSKDNPYDVDEFRKNHYQPGPWSNVLKLSPDARRSFSDGRGQIDGVVFKDIRVYGKFPYSIIAGYDSTHVVKNVRFSNLRVNENHIKDTASGKISVEFAHNVVFD